jgi:hypothetical protein
MIFEDRPNVIDNSFRPKDINYVKQNLSMKCLIAVGPRALVTILLTCALYERSNEIVMLRSKTQALFVSKTPFR